MNERAVDFSISTGAALLGVALLVAAVLRLTEPIALQIAAMPANVRVTPSVVPRHGLRVRSVRPRNVHVTRIQHALGRPRVTLRSARLNLVTIPAKRTPVRPIAGVPVAARPTAKVALRAHQHAHIAAVDADTLPEPPIGYDPMPALAAPDIGVAPPAIDTSDLPGVLVARRHRR